MSEQAAGGAGLLQQGAPAACLTVFPAPAAPPKILSVAVEGSEQTGLCAVCRVQGSPLPDLQWLGPDDLLEGSERGPLAQGSGAHYQTVSELREVVAGQHYTCSASNPLGREQATLYVLAPPAQLPSSGAPGPLLLLLSAALGAKLLLLLGTGLWALQAGALQGTCCWWR